MGYRTTVKTTELLSGCRQSSAPRQQPPVTLAIAVFPNTSPKLLPHARRVSPTREGGREAREDSRDTIPTT
jgi:hypothetical protein